jgi:hypothetical protein
MRPLRPGQDIVLSSKRGAVDCRVLAAAGRFVLLQPARPGDVEHACSFAGTSSLTYLDGMVPMGWDGQVELGSYPGELRFRIADTDRDADRRSSVRVPVFAQVVVQPVEGDTVHGHILDVSAGGLRFRHAGRFLTGQPVHVHAELPGDLVVEADAVVRAAEGGVTSVEFTAMYGVSAQEIGAWTVGVLRAHLATSL